MRMNRIGLIAALLLVIAAPAGAQALAGAAVRADGGNGSYAAEGVVEAVRQSVIATQVAGAVTQIAVKAGDAVKVGQVLARIDAHAANAELAAARQEFQRQKTLLDKKFISRSAYDLAEARFKTTQAQTGFYTLTAPYAGLVAEVPATQGDMALPGKPLMTVYDPKQMRVTAHVPQEIAVRLVAGQAVRLEIPGLSADTTKQAQQAAKITVLPMVDATTHTVQLRLELPSGLAGLTPGMFARVLLPVTGGDGSRLYVPSQAVFRRAELTAVYVLNAQGKPLLRQIKPGPVVGNETEVLAGLSAGEQVALDPLAAAKVR
jgi:RND family efflux transporter MFP subunit